MSFAGSRPEEAAPILRDLTLRNDVQLIVAASDDEARTLARDLTHRMMDRAPPEVERGNETAAATASLLLIGLTDEVHELSAELELPPTPRSLAGRGSARVWVMRRAGREPLLVVEAEDAAALEALLRPLPHYGGSSFLVFDGGQAVARGVWPATHSPLTRRLE
jgi:aminopeptidase N